MLTIELPSAATLPSSSGAPTNIVLSIAHTPLPKLSSADTLEVTNRSSIINLVLYFVAVKAPPEFGFRSDIVVSCRSNVVSPESKNISLLFENVSAPITSLVPESLMSKVDPNFIFTCDFGATIVCCKE